MDVGRIEDATLRGDGEDGERVGPGLGGYGGVLQRIERDVDARPAMIRLADLLAEIEHRRLVPITFPADDRDVQNKSDVPRVGKESVRPVSSSWAPSP